MKKSLMKKIIVLSSMGVVLTGMIIGNLLCYSHAGEISMFLSPDKPIINKDTVTETNSKGKVLVENICNEGITLLKNENNTLPLQMLEEQKYRVNLFGVGCTEGMNGFIYSGLGSGCAAITSKKITFKAALENAGFEINNELYTAYSNNKANFDTAWYDGNNTVLSAAKSYSDTAIITISRQTGENASYRELYDDLYNDTTNKSNYRDDDADGRNQVQLSLKEEAMIKYVGQNYEKVIVMINSGNTMELGALDNDNIDAVMYVSYLGENGTTSIANILTGKVNPSGHLTDTFAFDMKTNPTYVDAIRHEGAGKGLQIHYTEDIYIGYKWYETADKEGYWNNVDNQYGKGYDGVVQYPFGHGLSYTSFEWNVKDISFKYEDETSETGYRYQKVENGATFTDKDTIVEIQVEVKNTGNVPGKEVVQVYYSAPYTKGKIEKSHVNLVEFGKTDILYPESEASKDKPNSQILTLSFDIYDMASYDCYDKNNNGYTGWELDPGDYHIYLSNNAHQRNDCENSDITFKVKQDGRFGYFYLFDPDNEDGGIVYNRWTGSEAEAGVPCDGNSNGSKITYNSRSDFSSTFPKVITPLRTSGYNVAKSDTQGYYKGWDNDTTLVKPQLNNTESKLYLYTKEDGSKATNEDLRRTSGNKVVPNEELIMELGSNYYSPKWDELLSQLTIQDINDIVSFGGNYSRSGESIGKLQYHGYNGPCGYNTSIEQVGNSSEDYVGFPSEVIIGMTWNKELAREEGAAIGELGAVIGADQLWAPEVNLHRHAYNTRNFECYSEDPVLSGYMAANFIYGAKTHGLTCTLKHLVLSEAGLNPWSLNTWLTEQNLRENYLKAFEIAIKEGGANAIMSAFSNIGGVPSFYSYELLNGVLRQEWGFKGSVLTDYGMGQPESLIRAGNDVRFMPSGTSLEGLIIDENNTADVYCGVQAVKNEVYSFCNTYYTAKTYDPNRTNSMIYYEKTFDWWIPALIAVDIVLLSAMGLLIFFTFKRSKDGQVLVEGERINYDYSPMDNKINELKNLIKTYQKRINELKRDNSINKLEEYNNLLKELDNLNLKNKD